MTVAMLYFKQFSSKQLHFDDLRRLYLGKDVFTAPYSFAKSLNAEFEFLYPKFIYNDAADEFADSVKRLLPGANISFTSIAVYTKESMLEQCYLYLKDKKIDVLFLHGHFDYTILLNRVFKIYNPVSKSVVLLDTKPSWFDSLQLSHDVQRFIETVDLFCSSSKSMQMIANRKWIYGNPVYYFTNAFFNFLPYELPCSFESKENVILTVGRIGAEENDVLLRAFAMISDSIPEWSLRLVGPVQEGFKDFLDKYFTANPELKARVIVVGNLDDKEKLYKEYAKSKIFCITSPAEGGTPNVVGESLYFGNYQIHSSYDAAYETATNCGKIGDVFTVGNTEALAKLLVERCGDNEYLKNKYPDVIDYSRNCFSWEQHAHTMKNLLYPVSASISKSYGNDNLLSVSLPSQLRSTKTFREYCELLERVSIDTAIIVAVKDTPCSNSSQYAELQPLSAIGFTRFAEIGFRASYIGVLCNGRLSSESLSFSEEPISANVTISELLCEISSANFNAGNYAKVMIQGVDVSLNHRGINIVVVDTFAKMLLDSVCFDLFEGEQCIHLNDEINTERVFKGRIDSNSSALQKYKSEHSYPPAVNKKVYDIALFGYYYNANMGGTLTFYALHELLKSTGQSVLVVAHPKMTNLPKVSQRQLDVTGSEYKISKYRGVSRLHELRSYCDKFVLTSDQVWAGGWHFIPEYNFLGAADKTVKRICVASSFGSTEKDYGESNNSIASYLFSQMDCISVRESSAVNLLKYRFGIPGAVHILDPVFLYDIKGYAKLESRATVKTDGECVFVYLLDPYQEFVDFVNAAKSYINAEQTLYLTGHINNDDMYAKKVKTFSSLNDLYGFYPDATVADFIYNIKRASCVITDSYHGACYSVLFHKPFICLQNDARGNARFELFDNLGLSNRIFTRERLNESLNLINAPINWDLVDEKLNKLRELSFEWLEQAFGREFPRNYVATYDRIDKLENNKCTGCFVCGYSCPVKCIKPYKDDKGGFIYPRINENDCVNCGLCAKVCPVIQKKESIVGLNKVYCGYSLDDDVRYNSTSGGVFTELARALLEHGNAVVLGAAYETPTMVCHIEIDNVADLPKIRQSKYVQSEIRGAYPKIEKHLKDGKTVMFCGTPCQCGAVK